MNVLCWNYRSFSTKSGWGGELGDEGQGTLTVIIVEVGMVKKHCRY